MYTKRAPLHIRCSLSVLTLKEEIGHEIVATSVDTNESLGFLLIICQITPDVSSFSDCLQFFHEFFQTSIDLNNIISLEVFGVRLLRKLIYLMFCICKSFI